MKAVGRSRLQPYQMHMGAGVILWVLLALTGWVLAGLQGQPVLPLMLTLQEWVAAVLLLPAFLLAIVAIFQVRDVKAVWAQRMIRGIHLLSRMGATVFVLDILTRILFGLGFKPFYL